MGSLTLLSFAASFTCFWIDSLASAGSKTVKPGEDVTLVCQVHSTSEITVFEWRRPDINPNYVYYHRNEHVYVNKLFNGRAELKDKSLIKKGDVSLILKNVTLTDTGDYECRIVSTQTKRTKRDAPDLITTIHLKVSNSGGGAGHTKDGGDKDGHVGLIAVVVLVVLLLPAVGYVIYRKRGKKLNSNQAPADEEDVGEPLQHVYVETRMEETKTVGSQQYNGLVAGSSGHIVFVTQPQFVPVPSPGIWGGVH